MSNHPLTASAVRRSLTTLVVVGAVIGGGSSLAAPSDSPTHLSLARTYPVAELLEILIRRDQWRPFPTIEDRERWQALPQAVQTYLVARGEEARQTPWPGLPATLYLGYAREGNRARFEAVYFERRALLQQLVLAECVEARGRFLDAAADALWALCEESTWSEILHSATGGKLDVYGDPLIRNMGQFIVRAHIAGDYFVPVGDCAARFEPERGLVFRYGKRIQDPPMQALASAGASVESIMAGRFFGRQLSAVFEAGEILAAASVPRRCCASLAGQRRLQLMTARSRAGSPEGLFVAAWGAHNAQSHNHNDVGNVLIFADGQPVLWTPGPTYTAHLQLQALRALGVSVRLPQSAHHQRRDAGCRPVVCRQPRTVSNQRRVRGAANGPRPSLPRGGPGEVVAPHRETQPRPERRDHRSLRVDGGRRRHDAQLPHTAGG